MNLQDFELAAFSGDPAHGSFTTLAFQLKTLANDLNGACLSYSTLITVAAPSISTCLMTVQTHLATLIGGSTSEHFGTSASDRPVEKTVEVAI